MTTAAQSGIHLLGPGSWTIDGVDSGHVLKGSLKVPTGTVPGMTGRYGSASVAEFYDPQNPMLEIEFAQDDLALYARAMEATRSTSGANEVLGVGKTAGYRITPREIIFTPFASEISASRILKCFKCVPIGEPVFENDLKQQVLKATFKVLIDETQAEGEKFFKWGNTSVSADTSAPTISSQGVADGATGVSAAIAPTFTFDAQLDQATVEGEAGKANAFIIAATETSTSTPVAATVTYNNTTYTITITPTSSLSAGIQYNVMLTTGIKDAAGNRFAGYKMDFTIAP